MEIKLNNRVICNVLLLQGIDQETFDRYRTAELKHGRVAQLAVVGYLVPELIGKFPGSVGYPGE